jgi:hypothetical protein
MRYFPLGFVVAVALVVGGCGQESADEVEGLRGVPGEGSEGRESDPRETFLAPEDSSSLAWHEHTCPASNAAEFQKRATKVLAYVAGGSVPPTTTWACTNGQTTSQTASCLATMRSWISNESCTFLSTYPTTICSLPAGKADMICYGTKEELTQKADLFDACASLLDACWGNGASGFLHRGGSISAYPQRGKYTLDLGLDPEPARLTQPLSTSVNSVVAAVYVNSLTNTSVRYMGSSVQYNPGLAVGTPCSKTAPLAAGTQVYTTAQVYGTNTAYKICR